MYRLREQEEEPEIETEQQYAPGDSIGQHLASMGVRPADRNKVLQIGLWWPYYIRTLDHSHIPAMMALAHAAGDGQIVKRSAKTLRDHFNAGHQAYGVFHEGRLVAQSLIRTETMAPANLPLPGHLRDNFMKQSIMGGVVVAYEARGKGLMEAMIQSWQREAEKQGVGMLHARVRPENHKSWQVFLRNGLSITSQRPSPDEPDHDVYMMYKPLAAPFAVTQDKGFIARGGNNIGAQLDRGFIATGWNPHHKQFTFARVTPP